MKGINSSPVEIIVLDNGHIELSRTIIRDHPNPDVVAGTTVFMKTCDTKEIPQFIHILSNKQAVELRDALTKVLTYEPKTTQNPH